MISKLFDELFINNCMKVKEDKLDQVHLACQTQLWNPQKCPVNLVDHPTHPICIWIFYVNIRRKKTKQGNLSFTVSSFSDLWSLSLLPQLKRFTGVFLSHLLNFLGALKSVPFFVAMLFRNSSASSFLQMFTSNEAWNLCSSKISDSSKFLNS